MYTSDFVLQEAYGCIIGNQFSFVQFVLVNGRVCAIHPITLLVHWESRPMYNMVTIIWFDDIWARGHSVDIRLIWLLLYVLHIPFTLYDSFHSVTILSLICLPSYILRIPFVLLVLMIRSVQLFVIYRYCYYICSLGVNSAAFSFPAATIKREVGHWVMRVGSLENLP